MIGFFTIRCLNADNKELLLPVDHAVTYEWAKRIGDSYEERWNMGYNIYLWGRLIDTSHHPLTREEPQ